jgi:hypothetical protein
MSLRALSSRLALVSLVAAVLLPSGAERASAQAAVRAASLGVPPGAAPGAAEEKVLVRMLADAQSFRVRTRAAVSLARFTNTDVLVALEDALRDRHPAVRIAAARTLAANGGKRSVAALRDAARDSTPGVATEAKAALRAIAARHTGQPAVASAAIAAAVSSTNTMTRLRRAQHVVVLGDMQDRTAARSRELSHLLLEQVGAQLAKLDRVAVLQPADLTDEARAEIAKKKITMLRLEGNVQSVQPVYIGSERRVRCEVSILLLDEATRALRSMLRGAASAVAQQVGVAAQQEKELAHKALRSAVQTAMSSATEAIKAAASGVAPESDDAQEAKAPSMQSVKLARR